MNVHRIHSARNRVVSTGKQYIRPIASEETAASIAFLAKLDLNLDATGIAQIKKMSFDTYSECDIMFSAVRRYFE